MAEMHPILWTRVADRRLGHPHVKVAVLFNFTHRSSDLADIPIVFKPGTDLAILIANHIITTGRVNRDFVGKHTNFVKGATEIGYGLRPDDPRELKLRDGKLNFYWIQVNNNLQAAPNSTGETYPGYRSDENFIIVSDAYPTVTAMAADLILPAAMWVEKEGAYGNAERRTHVWHQLVEAKGEARSDLWQMMEFSKRFTTDEVCPATILDQNPKYKGKPCTRCCSRTVMSIASR